MEDAFDRALREIKNYFSVAEEGLRRAHSDVLAEARQKEMEKQKALRQQGEDANSRLKEMETAYAEIAAELEHTQQKLSDSHGKIQTLHAKNESLESKSEALKREWKSQCAALQKENEKLRGDIEVALGYRKRCGILERNNTQLRHELGLMADKYRVLEAQHKASTLGRAASASGSGVGICPDVQPRCSPSVKCTARGSQQEVGVDGGATAGEAVEPNTSDLKLLLKQYRRDNRSLRKGYKRVREESLWKGLRGSSRMVSVGVQAQGKLEGVVCGRAPICKEAGVEQVRQLGSGSAQDKQGDSTLATCIEEKRKLPERATAGNREASLESQQPPGFGVSCDGPEEKRRKLEPEPGSRCEDRNKVNCLVQTAMEGEPRSKGPCGADDALVIDLLDPPDAMPQAFETPRDAGDGNGAGSDGQAPHLAMPPALGANDVVPPEQVKTETGRETQKSADPQKKDVVSVIDLFDPAVVTTPSLESPEDGRDDGAEGEDGRPGPVPAHSKLEPSGRTRTELCRGEPNRSRKGGVRQNSRSPAKRQLNPLSPRSTVPGRLPLITQPGPRAAIPPAPVVDKAVGADIQGDEIQHKYAEVVRNKSAREALPAFECPDCAAFYDALESWGHAPGTVPPCGHTKPQGGAVQHPGQPSRQGMQASTRLLCQKGSRHRFRFPPPPTPDGFWDLGFNDSEQCN